MRVLVFLLLASVCCVTVWAHEGHGEEEKDAVVAATRKTPKGVHLSFGDSSSDMTVMFSTADSVACVVLWGRHKQSLSQTVSAEMTPLETGHGYMHTATLANVVPRTPYYYQCKCGDDKSQVYRFSREGDHVPESDSITFYSYGDVGAHYDHSETTINAVAKEPLDAADFVFHAGDLAYAFHNMTRWRLFMERIEKIGARVPYLVCLGNRDDVPDVSLRFKMPVREGRGKRNLFWSFRYGYILGIVLSVGGQQPYGEKSEQFEWLKAELEQADALRAAGEISWIVVWAHTPIYSSSNGHAGGNKDMRGPLEELLARHKITLMISGDDHVYERSFPRFADDVVVPGPSEVMDSNTFFVQPKYPTYFTVGTGGIDLDGWMPGARPVWSAHRELAHGYLKVVATVDLLTASFVRASDGKVLDTVHIGTKGMGMPRRIARRDGLSSVFLFVVVVAVVVFYWHRKNSQINQSQMMRI